MGKTLGIDRETARRIKRMSRQELDGYLSRVTDRSYDNGYEEGLPHTTLVLLIVAILSRYFLCQH